MAKSREESILLKFLLMFMKKSGRVTPFKLPSDIEDAGSILFVDSGELTDILFYAPLVNYFKNKYPSMKSTMVVDERYVPIVRGLMKLNVIISYRRDQMKLYKAEFFSLIKKVKEKHSDVAVLMGSNFSAERYLITAKSGASIRIGLYNRFSFPFINCEVRVSRSDYEGRRAEKILSAVGLKKDDSWESPKLSDGEIAHARQLIHFRKPEKGTLTVGVDPGKSKTRHYIIPEVIAYLANNLASRKKVKFIILSAQTRGGNSDDFRKHLKADIIDLEPSNIMETISFLSQCDLFISGNTDLFHFSVSLGVPTIGLFTQYDFPRWVPEGFENVRIITGSRGEKLSLKDFFGKVDELLAIERKKE